MKNSIFSVDQAIPRTEIDYSALMNLLSEYYQAPAKKLQELQKSEILIRLKKGFYVLNPEKTSRTFRAPIVANLLYGPSYLSLEYALSFHGLIPERVEEMTSVTTAKNKTYPTQVGVFSYHHLAAELYPVLIQHERLEDGDGYLIATPEKSIFDFLTLKTKETDFKKPSEIKEFLEEDLRMDWSQLLSAMNAKRLVDALPRYQRRLRVRWFIESILKDQP